MCTPSQYLIVSIECRQEIIDTPKLVPGFQNQSTSRLTCNPYNKKWTLSNQDITGLKTRTLKFKVFLDG